MRPPCIISSRECNSVEPPAFCKPAGRIQGPERGWIKHRRGATNIDERLKYNPTVVDQFVNKYPENELRNN